MVELGELRSYKVVDYTIDMTEFNANCDSKPYVKSFAHIVIDKHTKRQIASDKAPLSI